MNIDFLKRKLLIKYPRFGKELANVLYQETFDIDTVSTNGKVIFYNPRFMEKLSINQQIFVLAHELCHITFNHILRSRGKDYKLWNIACDGVINAWLSYDGLVLVDNCINIPEAINMDAEELYEKLLNDKQYNSIKCIGHASHDMWKMGIESKTKFDNNDKISECSIYKDNLVIKKKFLKELRDSIIYNPKLDDCSQLNQFNIDNIGMTKPKTDWRKLLRESIHHNVDWSYYDASIENSVLVPRLEKKLSIETEILLDTSGSVSDELLKMFLRECKNILQFSKMKVGCFDRKFYGFFEVRNEKDIDDMIFYGRGNTNFDVAVSSFSKRIENKIIFTDGYSIMPKKWSNIIWIVYGTEKINPLGGKVIYIQEKDLHYGYNGNIHEYVKMKKTK